MIIRWSTYIPKDAEITGVRFADLQYVDGHGELPGFPGAAAELRQDLPALEPMPLSLGGVAQ